LAVLTRSGTLCPFESAPKKFRQAAMKALVFAPPHTRCFAVTLNEMPAARYADCAQA
jgi:hypothetical protein